MPDFSGLDQFVGKTSNDATLPSKLALEASLIGSGVAQGALEKLSETISHPLQSAATIGGYTALSYGVGWAAMRYAPSAFGLAKYALGAALVYEAGSSAVQAGEAALRTWEKPETYAENKDTIATAVGRPLADCALYSLVGVAAYWRGGVGGKAAGELAGSLELQATKRTLATHIPILDESAAAHISQMRRQKDLTLSNVYLKAAPGVVQIHYAAPSSGPGKGGSYATGFFVEDGLIATNNHVLHGRSNPTIKTADGRLLEAKLVARDKTADLALLSVAKGTAEGRSLALGSSAGMDERSRVIMVGHPQNVSKAVASDGIVIARNGQKFVHPTRGIADPFPSSENFFENISYKGSPGLRDLPRPLSPATVIRRDVISHTAPTQPGNSGSPLLDEEGLVVGVHSIGGEYKWASSVEHLQALITAYKTTPAAPHWLRVITNALPQASSLNSSRGFAYTKVTTGAVEIAHQKAF